MRIHEQKSLEWRIIPVQALQRLNAGGDIARIRHCLGVLYEQLQQMLWRRSKSEAVSIHKSEKEKVVWTRTLELGNNCRNAGDLSELLRGVGSEELMRLIGRVETDVHL